MNRLQRVTNWDGKLCGKAAWPWNWLKLIGCACGPMLDWLETCLLFLLWMFARNTPCSWNDVTRFEGRVSPWHKLAPLLSVVTCCHVGVLKTAIASERTLQNKTGWWFGTMEFQDFPHIVKGMSSSQLTNSIIFQRGRSTTNQISYPGNNRLFHHRS